MPDMNKYAHIEDGVVTNVSLWDGVSEFDPGEGVTLVLANDDVIIGGTYDGEFHYVAPTPPEPTPEESARQEKIDSAKAKLEDLGLTTEEVKEAFGI